MRDHRQRLTLESFMHHLAVGFFVTLAMIALFAWGWNWFFVNIEEFVR